MWSDERERQKMQRRDLECGRSGVSYVFDKVTSMSLKLTSEAVYGQGMWTIRSVDHTEFDFSQRRL